MVGWWFYVAVPVGVLAGAIIGGQYVAAAVGGDDGMVLLIAGTLLFIAFAANYVGLRLSGRLQLLLVSLLVLLLLVTMLTAAPHATVANFQPFAPHGCLAIGTAASVLYAFAGWEAASHLSAEFRHPARHIGLATAMTLAIVGVLYVGLTATVFGVLGPEAARTDVPLTLLLERGMGPATRVATAAAAVFLTLGAINAYIAGGARLGAALGRDGALPRWLATGGSAGDVPRRSLTAQAIACAVTGVASVVRRLDLDTLMRATSACLVAVTAAGMFAAVRLLPRRTPLWWGALIGSGFPVGVFAFCGPLVVIPHAARAAREPRGAPARAPPAHAHQLRLRDPAARA
ncbi:APC family permease [Luedemannella flava]